MILKAQLKPVNNEFLVVCPLCDEVLDVVPDKRTAYLRTQQYVGHVCKPSGNGSG